MTLLKATIGQMSGQIELQLTAYYAGLESNEGLNPSLAGIRMKDGSFVQVAEGGSYYKDRVNLVYVVEYRNFNEIIDLSQVEALAFQSGWKTMQPESLQFRSINTFLFHNNMQSPNNMSQHDHAEPI